MTPPGDYLTLHTSKRAAIDVVDQNGEAMLGPSQVGPYRGIGLSCSPDAATPRPRLRPQRSGSAHAPLGSARGAQRSSST